MKFRILELFGGIGGFGYGIKKAFGWKNVEIAGYYDIDKYATAVFNYNFGTRFKPTDIREVRARDIPEFDCLCAGFPCQPFSVAGKRRGFKDTRGTLFFEIARILEAKRPSHFVLENVKGLLGHEKGKTFRIILETLDELGYEYQWMVLNSKFFGVPQNRERVFIVGHIRGEPIPEILPFRADAGKVQEIHKGEVARTLDANMSRGVSPRYYFEKKRRNLIFVVRSRHGRHVSEVRKDNTTNTLTSVEKDNYVAELRPKQIIGGSQGMRVYDPSGISTTVSAGQGGLGRHTGLYMVDDLMVRRLTPIEAERLQGFPDNWTKYGKFWNEKIGEWEVREISDTQRYKMLGNAVTTKVVEVIFRKFKESVWGE